MLLLAVLVFFLILAAGCGGSVRPWRLKDTPSSSRSYVINGKRYYILDTAEGYQETGLASWYGPNFHGRKTANGEKYNMYALTAAHKTLPLNTWVKVTNRDNGRSVIVRVNDRGPFVRGRIIDLSYKAAQKVDVVGPGTARVEVQALGEARERKVAGNVNSVLVQPKSYREGRFAVQVASFKDRQKAVDLARSLGQRYGSATVDTFDRGDAVYYRVQVADLRNLNQAASLQTSLERRGYRDCYVVAR